MPMCPNPKPWTPCIQIKEVGFIPPGSCHPPESCQWERKVFRLSGPTFSSVFPCKCPFAKLQGGPGRPMLPPPEVVRSRIPSKMAGDNFPGAMYAGTPLKFSTLPSLNPPWGIQARQPNKVPLSPFFWQPNNVPHIPKKCNRKQRGK